MGDGDTPFEIPDGDSVGDVGRFSGVIFARLNTELKLWDTNAKADAR